MGKQPVGQLAVEPAVTQARFMRRRREMGAADIENAGSGADVWTITAAAGDEVDMEFAAAGKGA